MSNETNAEETGGIIREAVKANREATFGGLPFAFHALAHHKDIVIRPIKDEERKETDPGRIRPRGTVEVHDLQSFIRLLCEEQVGNETAVFCSAAKQRIVAVINHGSTLGERTGHGWGWGDRRIVFPVKKSAQLVAWESMTGLKSQVEFAEFLEDHAMDVATPAAADIREIVLELEATKEGVCKAKTNLQNGSIALEYADEVRTSVELPRQITLAIPLFEGAGVTALPANFRFRIQDQKPKFCLTFPGLADRLRRGFQAMVDELAVNEKVTALIISGECPEA